MSHLTQKSTGNQFTSVNFLESPNASEDYFLTSSANGQLSIYSVNKNQISNNSRSKQKHKIVKRMAKNLGDLEKNEKIVSASLFGNDKVVAITETSIYFEQTNLNTIQGDDTQEEIQLLTTDCIDLKNSTKNSENHDVEVAPIVASTNNRYSNRMHIADSSGNIFIVERNTGKIRFYYTNDMPITDVVSITDSPSVFGVSDLGGSISLYDDRTRTRIFKHHCQTAPALLCLSKSNTHYNSQNILASGAENGQIYLYDLKAGKMSKRSIFDKTRPYPIYTLQFNSTNPETLYSGGMQHLMEITSLNSDYDNNRIWFGEELENRKRNRDSGLNSSESNISQASSDEQARLMNTSAYNLSVDRTTIYENELCNFISSDFSDRGKFVAASDNGVLVYI